MKLIRLVLLSGFWLLCGCPNGIGADYLDQKTYALEDEASYAVLIYDIHNSFILSLLGVQSDGPDQAGQIEALRKRDEYAVLDQELFAALVKGSMNLPAIKERTIREIRKQKISIWKRKFSFTKLAKAASYYNQELDQKLKSFNKAGSLNLAEALIDRYIFDPDIDYGLFEEGLPIPLVNSAVSIAVTRFDNRKWHEKIFKCGKEQAARNKDSSLDKQLLPCFKDYSRAVSKEAAKVAGELLPYRTYFENIQPVPDKTEMVKKTSEDGKSYMWVPKE